MKLGPAVGCRPRLCLLEVGRREICPLWKQQEGGGLVERMDDVAKHIADLGQVTLTVVPGKKDKEKGLHRPAKEGGAAQ
eukprot:scaffold189231_cov31-Tisochrysis_lutea.AAC.1